MRHPVQRMDDRQLGTVFGDIQRFFEGMASRMLQCSERFVQTYSALYSQRSLLSRKERKKEERRIAGNLLRYIYRISRATSFSGARESRHEFEINIRILIMAALF